MTAGKTEPAAPGGPKAPDGPAAPAEPAAPGGPTPPPPRQCAPGVYWLTVGRGLLRANVYFVRSGAAGRGAADEGASWVLVDAGAEGCAPEVRQGAEALFGDNSPPAAILLTHDHPDHAGSAADLARAWDCPVWVHPDELPIVRGDIATFKQYAHPLDRRLILPLLSLLSKKQIEAIVSRGSLKDVARALDMGRSPAGATGHGATGHGAASVTPASQVAAPGANGPVPGLPDWQAVPTPGHTPGHVAFFRGHDRVLITGDAVVTLKLESLRGLVFRRPGVSGPPWYVTWDRALAKKAIGTLAELEPLLVAGGHGEPLGGPDLPEKMRALAGGA